MNLTEKLESLKKDAKAAVKAWTDNHEPHADQCGQAQTILALISALNEAMDQRDKEIKAPEQVSRDFIVDIYNKSIAEKLGL